jgi:DNA (cytosine-5)-methyltransferase 1
MSRANPIMMRPRLLDLFCGAGGASVGYHRAGFDVVGVDINPQPDYPFEFHRADALTFPLDWFDTIHASPPCQGYTTMSNRHRGQGGKADSHGELIDATRWRLTMSGLPWVIENVAGARSQMQNPVTLSGGAFGLGVERPRLFESSVPLTVPKYVKVADPIGVYGRHHDGRRLFTRRDGSSQWAAKTLAEGQSAMGIDWMPWASLTESIPPAYTEFIGAQLLAHLRVAA